MKLHNPMKWLKKMSDGATERETKRLLEHYQKRMSHKCQDCDLNISKTVNWCAKCFDNRLLAEQLTNELKQIIRVGPVMRWIEGHVIVK